MSLVKLARMVWSNPFYMAGTEDTGNYAVLGYTALGRIGVRDLGHVYRVRVESLPLQACKIAQVLTRDRGWKQPGDGGQLRFSTVVVGSMLRATVGLALKAIGANSRAAVYNRAAKLHAIALSSGITKGISKVSKVTIARKFLAAVPKARKMVKAAAPVETATAPPVKTEHKGAYFGGVAVGGDI